MKRRRLRGGQAIQASQRIPWISGVDVQPLGAKRAQPTRDGGRKMEPGCPRCRGNGRENPRQEMRGKAAGAGSGPWLAWCSSRMNKMFLINTPEPGRATRDRCRICGNRGEKVTPKGFSSFPSILRVSRAVKRRKFHFFCIPALCRDVSVP